jgi:hypothetical protein
MTAFELRVQPVVGGAARKRRFIATSGHPTDDLFSHLRIRQISVAMPLPHHLSEEVLGYRLHTNRELGMMLRREKPLAIFSSGIEGNFGEPLGRYLQMFDRHVGTGEFVKREYVESIDIGQDGSHRHVHVILYALPEEAWRLDAMIELLSNLGPAWTASDEREEGKLLGYTDAENDTWIANRFGKK